MQNGLSANAFIKVKVKDSSESPQSAIIPAGFQISTYPEGGRGREESASVIIFETLEDQLVDVLYNKIDMEKNEKNNKNNSFNIKNSSATLNGRFSELKKGRYILLFQEDSS